MVAFVRGKRLPFVTSITATLKASFHAWALEVAKLRADDAKQLMRASRLNGALYLMGYAVECHLKFAVCDRNEWSYLPVGKVQVGSHQFSDLYTHDWDALVSAAQLRSTLMDQPLLNALYSSVVEQWGPFLRYQSKQFAIQTGRQLYNDLVELYCFLKETAP